MRFVLLLWAGCLISGCGSETNEDREIVFIDDGAVACEEEGLSEEKTALILRGQGIDVISSGCAYITGVSIPDVCGIGDLNINIHTIHAQNLPDAEELGFESVSTLRNGSDSGYERVDCESQERA
jgi:hypothetical protein